jgi:hypothetical protein
MPSLPRGRSKYVERRGKNTRGRMTWLQEAGIKLEGDH